jgi:hypothetical protein
VAFINAIRPVNGRPIVFTRGFAVRDLDHVYRFKAAGVTVWWFHGHYAAARREWVRINGIAGANIIDAQLDDVKANEASIRFLYGRNNTLRTLDRKGRRLFFEKIATPLRLHLPHPNHCETGLTQQERCVLEGIERPLLEKLSDKDIFYIRNWLAVMLQ